MAIATKATAEDRIVRAIRDHLLFLDKTRIIDNFIEQTDEYYVKNSC
jgi:hypothetical protein